MNVVVISGRLTEDPVVRERITILRVANNEGFGDKRKTNYVDVKTFQKTAELCGQYLKKGRFVIVQGRLDHEQYEDKNGNKRSSISIIANTVDFGEGGGSDGSDESNSESDESKPKSSGSSNDSFNVDDVPF